MELKLQELQAIESIMFDLTNYYSPCHFVWTLKANSELLQATALPYEEGKPSYKAFSKTYNAVHSESLLGLFNYQAYFPIVAKGLEGRFNNFEAVSGWLLHTPAELLLRCSKPELLNELDLKKLDFLPPALHNVTLLNSNTQLPFVIVDKEQPIQIISLELIEKQN